MSYMKYLLLILLAGCTSTPKYQLGDCVQFYQIYKLNEESFVFNNEPYYTLIEVKTDQKKVSCP